MFRSGLSKGSGSTPRKISQNSDPNVKINSGSGKPQNSHGIWASSKDIQTDSQRNLSRKSGDEMWPMGTVGVTKDVDANSASKENSLKDTSLV